MLKKTTFTLYAIVIIVMAMATFIEKTHGTPYVLSNIYGSWWFTALWAALALLAITYIIRRKLRKVSAMLLHFSFIIILVGALLTHLTAWQGYVHLRKGDQPMRWAIVDNQQKELPFAITLDSFNIRYHNGTEAAADYESHFTITTSGGKRQGFVSMNNIYSAEGIRFYQSGYDEDMEGSTLTLNSDPWGIPITYTGYGLLFLSMLLVLIDPKGQLSCGSGLGSAGSGSAGNGSDYFELLHFEVAHYRHHQGERLQNRRSGSPLGLALHGKQR